MIPKRSHVVNIDGDVINYAVGFACQTTWYRSADDKDFEDKTDALAYAERYDQEAPTKFFVAEDIGYALNTTKKLLARIMKGAGATRANILLTGEGNFREDIATLQPYKGNRMNDDGTPKQEKPLLFHEIQDYLIYTKGAEVITGEEADDQLSIRAVRDGETIATIDKDLNNTAGWHFNWNNNELYYITEVEADRNFHLQLLTGDATDHIPGLKKITGKMATAGIKRPLLTMTDPAEMYAHVHEVYVDKLMSMGDRATLKSSQEYATECLLEIGRLLWMRREEGELWTP